MQQKVWVDLVRGHIYGAAGTAFLVDQMRGNALEAKAVAAVCHECIFDHAHTYRAREVVLTQAEQFGSCEVRRVS